MTGRKKITSKNPVYLYKFVRNSNKDAHENLFKEFIVVKAWESDKDFRQVNDDCLYFDYYQNGRHTCGTKVSKKFGIPYTTTNSFSVWFYNRNDREALRQAKQWLRYRNYKFRRGLAEQAKKLLVNLEFASKLSVEERVDDYEQKP